MLFGLNPRQNSNTGGLNISNSVLIKAHKGNGSSGPLRLAINNIVNINTHKRVLLVIIWVHFLLKI